MRAHKTFNSIISFSIENIKTDLFIHRTCEVILGLNTTECDVVHKNSSSQEAKDIQKLVQPYTATIIILKSCLETLIPSVVALFLGPWSDRNGRKPLLFASFSGSSRVIPGQVSRVRNPAHSDLAQILHTCLLDQDRKF